MVRRGGGYSRGLLIALLVITVSAVMEVPVHAMTVDDLRAYLGMAVEEREITMIKVPESSEENLDVGDSAVSTDSEALTLEQLNRKLLELETSYEQSMKSNVSAIRLIAMLNNIKDLKAMIVEQSKLLDITSNVDVDELIRNSEEYNTDSNEENKIGNYNFNIGDVGDTAVSPANNILSLVTPYGYKLNEDKTHEDKNNSISLSVPVGDNVLSQWNGQVAYVEDDGLGSNKAVTIFHGQGLYTVYHNVIPLELYVGKRVYQGTIIGNAGQSNTVGTDESNSIEYQIILDGVYLNPLLIFGNRGRDMYNDWLKHSNEVYTVEDTEEFYYKSSMSRENKNNDTSTMNTIEGAAEIVGEYKLPDPGVVR